MIVEVPDKIFSEEMTPNAKILYIYIKGTGNTDITNKEIAAIFNCTIQSASKWIHELTEKGYIKTNYEYKLRHFNYVNQTRGIKL